MEEKSLMHIKIMRNEAVQNKKEILMMEFSSLKILEALQKYYRLRTAELKAKADINKRTKKINLEINKLRKMIPDLKVPRKYKIDLERKIPKEEEPQKKRVYSSSLERELQEIQDKLKQINQKF